MAVDFADRFAHRAFRGHVRCDHQRHVLILVDFVLEHGRKADAVSAERCWRFPRARRDSPSP